jgi:acyl-CoA reductase-like NAD-dependent aldehyde dehydrogenase
MAATKHLSRLTDEQVREAFHKIKAIEEKASTVMDEVKNERSTFNRRVYDEIQRRKKQLTEETALSIGLIERQTQTEVEKRISEIEQDKINEIEKVSGLFANGRVTWRKKILSNVLAGV